MQNSTSKSPKGTAGPRSVTSTSPNSNTDAWTAMSSTRTRSDVILSQNKVRAIMKSSPEVDHVGNDALLLVTKAAELFIDHMTRTTVSNPRGQKSYEYSHFAEVVKRETNLEFLREIVPMKITGRQALQEVAKQQQQALMMDKLI